MIEFFEMLYSALLTALILAPVCYLTECAIARILLYKKHGKRYSFYLKAYHWRFKLFGVTILRGMPIQIKTPSETMRIIAGKVIGVDDTGMIYVFCTDGAVVSYPLDKIDLHDISISQYFPKDLEKS